MLAVVTKSMSDPKGPLAFFFFFILRGMLTRTSRRFIFSSGVNLRPPSCRSSF